VLNTAGSFMSFQNPAKPSAMKSLYSPPHQARVEARVKSGNTDGPGHTGAT
jgi:hypothetical protein